MSFTEIITNIRKSKLIDMGFCRNQWLWFHIFAAALLFKGLLFFGVSSILSVIIVSVFAIIWEFVEFYIECGGKWENVKKTYGSIEKWKYDTIGDILGAVIIVLIMLI